MSGIKHVMGGVGGKVLKKRVEWAHMPEAMIRPRYMKIRAIPESGSQKYNIRAVKLSVLYT